MIIEEQNSKTVTSREFEKSDIQLNSDASPLLISMLTELLYKNPLKLQ